jgi:hypothetical protein
MKNDELNPRIDNEKAARRELAFFGLVGPGSKQPDGLEFLSLTSQNAGERDPSSELEKMSLSVMREARAEDDEGSWPDSSREPRTPEDGSVRNLSLLDEMTLDLP